MRIARLVPGQLMAVSSAIVGGHPGLELDGSASIARGHHSRSEMGQTRGRALRSNAGSRWPGQILPFDRPRKGSGVVEPVAATHFSKPARSDVQYPDLL